MTNYLVKKVEKKNNVKKRTKLRIFTGELVEGDFFKFIMISNLLSLYLTGNPVFENFSQNILPITL